VAGRREGGRSSSWLGSADLYGRPWRGHPSNHHRLAHDPELQRLFYWPSPYLASDYAGLFGTRLSCRLLSGGTTRRQWSGARPVSTSSSVARQRVGKKHTLARNHPKEVSEAILAAL
jgi:hypothetical protein